ncbi:hypothetical protein [Selenomonas sp. AE3005]|uniref:hypothetical protein n=1 Tax=Selenomonas sp. AE3005 TaxID=1485543 RepID=UPI0025ECE53F|nr:hypothetical protein [Selenomonas sp. AE3005]
MYIIAKNEELINRCDKISKRIEESIGFYDSIEKIEKEDYDLDDLQKKVTLCVELNKELNYEYSMISNEFDLFNNNYFNYNQYDGQRVLLYLNTAIIKPDKNNLLIELGNIAFKKEEEMKGNNSKEYVLLASKEFETLSDEEKRLKLIKALYGSLHNIFFIEAKVSNLVVAINYLNYKYKEERGEQ